MPDGDILQRNAKASNLANETRRIARARRDDSAFAESHTVMRMGSCKLFHCENHIRRAEGRYGGFADGKAEIFDYLPGSNNRHRLSVADVEQKL